MDAYKLEDAQFDLLIGKPVADENMRNVLSDASTSSESRVNQAMVAQDNENNKLVYKVKHPN